MEPPHDDGLRAPMDQLSAHLDRGWELIGRGDLSGALFSAQKALELEADNPDVHNLLGYIYAAEGRPEDALEEYERALELDESYLESMLNAAELLIHPLHRFEAALELLEEALSWVEGPDEQADVVLLKIDALMHMGDRERALAALRSLPEGPFDSAHVEMLVGRAYFDLGEAEAAEPYIERAVASPSPLPDAAYYQGLLLEKKGKKQEATVAFLRSRHQELSVPLPPWSLAPEHFEARVQRAVARLPEALARPLSGSLVVVTDLPGAEVVAEGVDPRVPLLLDDLSDPDKSTDEEPPRVGRLFIYQRNVERLAAGLLEVEDEIVGLLTEDLRTTFPALDAELDAQPSGAGEPAADPAEEEASGALSLSPQEGSAQEAGAEGPRIEGQPAGEARAPKRAGGK